MAHQKINIVVRMQHWMDSVPGQTFLNYAYSWGASIVILGTLFKLTPLPGADLMLFIGMGTEVIVFFLSAFDRPFDKNEVNKELADDYLTDEEIAAGMNANDEENEEDSSEESAAVTPQGATIQGGGTVIIGGSFGAQSAAASGNSATPIESDGNTIAPNSISFQPQGGTNTSVMGNQSDVVAASVAMDPETLAEATKSYIEKLQSLTEVLERVEEQSRRLTTDSEEMTNLNRTLTGINTVYELQLKGVSSQIGTIDAINEQTRRMAEQIEELNGMYSRMIKALTINMKNAGAAQNAE